MSYDPQAAIGIARHYADIGYHEGPNNRNDFSFWQYGDFTEPWCDSFVCYCAWHAGFRFPPYSAHGEKGDSWVTGQREHALTQGIWRDRNYHAQTGDLVIFDFTEPDQHIEMVDADWGDWLATVGGNTSDRVARRHRYRVNVVGFCALTQAGQNGPTPVPAPIPVPVPVVTEEPMLVKPAAGDKALNVYSGAVVNMGPASAILKTDDCIIEPDPIKVTIATPYLGAIGWGGSDASLQPGEFVVVGKDKKEYKFTVRLA